MNKMASGPAAASRSFHTSTPKIKSSLAKFTRGKTKKCFAMNKKENEFLDELCWGRFAKHRRDRRERRQDAVQHGPIAPRHPSLAAPPRATRRVLDLLGERLRIRVHESVRLVLECLRGRPHAPVGVALRAQELHIRGRNCFWLCSCMWASFCCHKNHLKHVFIYLLRNPKRQTKLDASFGWFLHSKFETGSADMGNSFSSRANFSDEFAAASMFVSLSLKTSK